MQRFFERGKRAQPLFDPLCLGAYIEQAAAALLELAPQIRLALRQRVIALDEAVEQARQLVAASRQLGDFVLAEDLDARQDVLRQQIRHFAGALPDQRRVGNRALDAVLARRRPVRAHQQRDAGAALEHLTNDSLVRLARLVAHGRETENGANALDHGRFSAPPPPDEHIQVWIEVDRCAIQEATTFPGERKQRRVFLARERSAAGVEAQARGGVEKRLPQALDADLRHLDPAGGRRVGKICRLNNILGVDHRNRQVRFRRVRACVVGVTIADDLLQVVRQIVDFARDLNGQQRFALPRPNARVAVQRLKQPIVVADMRGDGDSALFVHLIDDCAEGPIGQIGRRTRVGNAELAEESLQKRWCARRRVDAQEVNSLARAEFETREDDESIPGGAAKVLDAAHAVVIGDRQNRDSKFQRLVHNRPGVRRRVAAGGGTAKVARIAVRVHLQRAAMEDSALWEPAGNCDWVVVLHCLPCPILFRRNAEGLRATLSDRPCLKQGRICARSGALLPRDKLPAPAHSRCVAHADLPFRSGKRSPQSLRRFEDGPGRNNKARLPAGDQFAKRILHA